MFRPRNKNRLNYGDMLCAPSGYTLERAVATTYTLDLSALTLAGFSLCMNSEIDTELLDATAMCYRSCKQLAEKAAVFCEAGKIKQPKKDNPIFAILSDAICTVSLKKSFHPKIWLAQYKNSSNHRKYKLLVLSKNLTFDRSYDCCALIEGEEASPSPDQSDINQPSVNQPISAQPLIDFLSYLKLHATSSRLPIVQGLIDGLKTAVFTSTLNGEEVGASLFALPADKSVYASLAKSEATVVSPFITAKVVQDLAANGGLTLFTRTSQLGVLAEAAKKMPSLPQVCTVYTLKNQIIDGESFLLDNEPAADLVEEAQPQDIHAKIYALNGAMYLGSANASHSAFNGNVEFMVGLYSNTNYAQQLFSQLTEKRRKQPSVFEQVDWQTIASFSAESELEAAKSQLHKQIKQLCALPMQAEVVDSSYGIVLRIDCANFSPFGNLTISPLGEGMAKPLAGTVEFSRVRLHHLSKLYTVTATAQTASGNCTVQSVIKIETLNIPVQDVEGCVVNMAIKSQSDLECYLEALLSDDVLQGYFANSGGSSGSGSGIEAGLYERLLHCSQHMPDRINEIVELNSKLQGGAISRQFKDMLDLFLAAIDSQTAKWGQ